MIKSERGKMRREDEERLATPYPPATPPSRERLAGALAIETPQLALLREAVFADFDETRGGIAWWYDHLDTRRRILISDHLWQCIASVSTNLIEARLHQAEVLEWWDRERRFVEHNLSWNDDDRLVIPKRLRPLDELPNYFAELHTVGFFRAIHSACDCIAGVVVGVGGLAVRLQTIAFGQMRAYLRSAELSTDFKPLSEKIDRWIAESGPRGWLDWALAFRNMLAHRGRTLQLARIQSEPSPLQSPSGEPLSRFQNIP